MLMTFYVVVFIEHKFTTFIWYRASCREQYYFRLSSWKCLFL